MTEPRDPLPPPSGALRREAEARLSGRHSAKVAGESLEVRSLIHELSVHQIELEMQNEELRRAQTRLETSRARYYDLYNEAPIGYFTVSLQTRIEECNRTGAVLLGVPAGGLTSRRFVDFVSPEARAGFLEAWDRLVASGASESLELPLILPDGMRVWVHLQMNLGHDEDRHFPVGRITVTDISERRRMAEETAQLAAIVTSASHAIISYNLRGEVMSWNAGAEALFGYAAETILGRRITVLFQPDRLHEEVRDRYAVARGETVAREVELRRDDGSSIPVFLTASPIRDRTGRVTGISYLALDIRPQVEARDKLARALGEIAASEHALREADRRKDDFIATLAHELRNPLAPIRNAAAVLRHSTTLDRSAGWARDVIDRQVTHMAALLEDLLDVSRITRSTITLKIQRVDLGRAIEQAVEIVRPQIEARRHQLSVSLPRQPVVLTGDPTRLTQIFDNLLSNAAKYTDPGGRIDLRLEVEGSTAVVRVRDTGIGIDPAHLPRIFELFSQVETAIDRAQGGLGIGLALVKGLVEKHGGSIEASSDGPGAGTLFVVRLPGASVEVFEADAAPPAMPPEPDPRVGPAGQLVLVVDDNADAVESMALMLRLHGFDVATAGSGEQALDLARERRPHVALLDVGMPGLNGYDVARRIREEPWGRDMILIACTGWGQPDDRRRTGEAGFDHHLVKPCAPETILRLLSAAAGVESNGDA